MIFLNASHAGPRLKLPALRIVAMTLSSMASGSAETALYSMRMALLDDPSSSLDQPLSKTTSNRSLPVGSSRVPIFPEQVDSGFAVIQEHGREGPLLAVSVLFEHVGEPGCFDHGLVRVDRVGGALPCPGLDEFRPASFDGHGWHRVSEPVVGEPFPHARPFGLVDHVPSSPSTWSSLPPTSPDRYSSAGSGMPVSGFMTMRSPSRSVVSMSSRVSSSRPMRSRSTCPTRSRLTAIASTGSCTCSGIGGTGVTTLLDSMSPLASKPLGPIFSKL